MMKKIAAMVSEISESMELAKAYRKETSATKSARSTKS